MPGAFTPTCSNNHLPGYLENFDAIKARGVDTIAVVATNDAFVMGAWRALPAAKAKSSSSRTAAAISPGRGWTSTSASTAWACATSASLIADDGVVTAINVESKPGVNRSGARTFSDSSEFMR